MQRLALVEIDGKMDGSRQHKPKGLKMMNATTTLQQIGNMTLFSIRARNFVSDENSVMFQHGRGGKNLKKVRVTLTVDDTYTVEFMVINNDIRSDKFGDFRSLETTEGVYAENLKGVIESNLN